MATKSKIINTVSKKLLINEKDIADVVNTFLETVVDYLEKDGEVRLQGFGGFKRELRPEFTYRDINTGQPKVCPPTYKVSYRISEVVEKELNSGLRKNQSEEGNLFDGSVGEEDSLF